MLPRLVGSRINWHDVNAEYMVNESCKPDEYKLNQCRKPEELQEFNCDNVVNWCSSIHCLCASLIRQVNQVIAKFLFLIISYCLSFLKIIGVTNCNLFRNQQRPIIINGLEVLRSVLSNCVLNPCTCMYLIMKYWSSGAMLVNSRSRNSPLRRSTLALRQHYFSTLLR